MSIYDEEKNLPAAYSAYEDEYKDVSEEETEAAPEENDDLEENEEVYELPESRSERNRIWSILSLVLGSVSIVLSPIVYYVSLILSLSALAFSGVSRKKFGFFTRLTLLGMIISIVGFAAGVSFAAAEIFRVL